LRLL
jgi:hypothetical protein